MAQRNPRGTLAIFAIVLASTSAVVAQSSASTETAKIPIDNKSAGDNWQAALQTWSTFGKLVVVTVEQPNRRQSCHLQSFTPDELVCTRAKGRRRTYLRQQVTALILPGDGDIKPWLEALGSGESGAAIWGTILLAGTCPACAAATAFVAFYSLIGIWVAHFADDLGPDRLLYLAPGQHLPRKFAHLRF